MQLLRQVFDDVAPLVLLAALDQGSCTEGLHDGLAQRLAAVDHPQPRTIGIESTLDEIAQDRRTLTVQRSKGRSRILPIRDDLVDELRQYLRRRDDILTANSVGASPAFFIRRNATALTLGTASNVLRQPLRELELKPPTGRAGARPYEFRHAFAMHRLTAWAIEGVDVHAQLPMLSAYLGHVNMLGTEVYLKATPELLELASQRFEQHARRRRRVP
jgi:integrase/recombinase XerD